MVLARNHGVNQGSGWTSKNINNDDDRDPTNDPNDTADESVNDISETVNDHSVPNNSSGPSDLKQQQVEQEGSNSPLRSTTRNAKIRDLLILKEINNDRLPTQLPSTCDMIFDDPNELSAFHIKVVPNEGYWNGGTFFFDVLVPDEYNFEPPKVKCTTKIWHPNITEDGSVCLSILRSGAIDETGWNPARQLKDVVLGINSLFTDLANFHDPLNNEAAEMFKRDPINFQAKVNAYIREYAQSDQ